MLYRRALHDAEKAYGAHNPRTGDARFRLGVFLLSNKTGDEGQACLARVLTDAEQAYGKDDPRLLPVLYKFTVDVSAPPAADFGEKPEVKPPVSLPQMEAYLLRAVTIAQTSTASAQAAAWSRLATCYRLQSREELAWKSLENALAAAEKAYGRYDSRVLPSLYALAEWSATEDTANMLTLYQRALEITRQAYGQTLPALAHLQRIAEIYDHLGKKPEAQALRRESVAIMEHSPEADPDEVVHLLMKLLPDEQDSTTIPSAQAHVIAYVEKNFGANSDEMVTLLQRLADMAASYSGNKPHLCLTYLQKLAKLLPLRKPAHSPELASALVNLARRYEHIRQRQAAIDTYEQALAILDALPKPELRVQYEITGALAQLYRQRGAWKPAEKYLQRWMALEEKVESKRVDIRLSDLVEFYRQDKNPTMARAMYAQFYDFAVKCEGATSQTAVQALVEQADACREAAQYSDAVALLERARQSVAQAPPPNRHDGSYVGQCLPAILALRVQVLTDWGKTAESEAALGELFAKAVDPKDNQTTTEFAAIQTLLENYQQAHEFARTAALLERILALPGQQKTAELLVQFGQAYAELHDPTHAEPCFSHALALVEKQDTGEGLHRRTVLRSLQAVANYYTTQGRHDIVEGIWRRRLARERQCFGEEEIIAYSETLLNLSRALVAERKFLEAEQQLLSVLTSTRAQAALHKYQIPYEYLRDAGLLYLAWAKPERAEPYFREALMSAEQSFKQPYEFNSLLPYLDAHAGVLRILKRDTEADALEERAKVIRKDILTP